jgi:spermidine synthase
MWIAETIDEDMGLKASFEGEIVYQETSEYQEIVVFDSKAFGRMLMLDGAVQLSKKDEKIYHSTMVNPILTADHKNVLIVGGGDGGILRELAKFEHIEKITMVELDQRVIDVSKEYLPFVSNGSFDDPRLNLVIQDAKIFIEETDEKYDLVIVDSTDPTEKGMSLYSEMFYRSIYNILSDHGSVICQVPTIAENTISYVLKTYKELFESTGYFFVSVPSFSFGNVMMIWGKKSE